MPAADLPTPFNSTEAAWFAVSQALASQSRPGQHVYTTMRCLDRLYRNRRIDLLHAHILKVWGRRGMAPNPARPRERSDWEVWREAIDRLEGPLRAQGIVAGLIEPAA